MLTPQKNLVPRKRFKPFTMSLNDQTHFKNLAAFAARFLKYV